MGQEVQREALVAVAMWQGHKLDQNPHINFTNAGINSPGPKTTTGTETRSWDFGVGDLERVTWLFRSAAHKRL